MRCTIICLVVLLLTNICFSQAGTIYSVSDTDANGKTIDFSKYKGKAILIINTASGSIRVKDEMNQLKFLTHLYKDSGLVVMIFPSNSFGNETKANNELKSVYGEDSSQVIGQKSAVKGAGMPALYEWLTQQAKNGVANVEVKSDFQKYLISRKGTLVGYFSGKLYPTDITLLNAISTQLRQ